MGALPGIQEESGSGESSADGAAAASLPPAVPPPAGPPEEFIDPISQEVMLDPVLLVESGQSYERATIEAWFSRCKEEGWPCTDPLTRQELRSCTVVPNFSLRSLVSGWAERQRISDLPSFAKAVGRQRSQAHSGGAAGAAAAALAGLRLGTCGEGVAAAMDSSTVPYPTIQPAHDQPDCPADAAAPPQQPQQGAAPAAGLPQPAAAPPQQPQSQQHAQLVHPEQPFAGRADGSQLGLYPSDQQPMLPDKLEQAETALGALRAAATQQGGARGAAAYNAWTLQQLAGDAEGRELLWEGNAIPLAIFLLGLLQRQPGDAALAAAAPALCTMLQRLGAHDAGVAASISQCGGLHALVAHLTAPGPELRAAACRALFFLGWMGSDLRAQTLAEMTQHAASCKLPPKPLLALWRFWEQPAQQQGGSSDGDAGSASNMLLPAGRAKEWESLALLLHMLAEGCSHEARSSADSAAAATALQPLDVTSSAVPAALAHAAALSSDPAVQFAAQQAVGLLSQLPHNRLLLIGAALQQGQQAGQAGGVSGCAAGRICWLLWALCSHPSGSSRPAAIHAVTQQGRALLATLQAALDPEQPPKAACRWLAAGLLTCLLFEPSARGDGSAAAAADAARHLLASTAAAPVLQGLLASLQPAAAAAAPAAARAAALAIANLAAFRGGAISTAAPAHALSRTQGSQGSGDFKEWLSAKLGGASKRGSTLQPAAQGQNGSAGPAAGPAAAAAVPADQQHDLQLLQHQTQAQAAQAGAPLAQQPTDPRGAVLFHGAMQALAALLVSSSAAAAASDAAARGGGVAGAPGAAAAALTPDSRQQVASAAAQAAEAAAQHRAVLGAALLALNNLCADPAAAAALRSTSRLAPGLQQQLQAALNVGLADRALPEASRSHARLLLHTLSGAPGQRHQPACTVLAPPQPAAAYPSP